MRSIVYSLRAIDNIANISAFIAEDNVAYADKVVDTIFSFVTYLAIFPELGSTVGSQKILRSIVEPSFKYRITYRIGTDIVEIVSISKYQKI